MDKFSLYNKKEERINAYKKMGFTVKEQPDGRTTMSGKLHKGKIKAYSLPTIPWRN